MRFDEWANEAGRSLQAWDPEPAALELAPAGGRPPGRDRRRQLGLAAAAVVVVAAVVGALAIRPTDTTVAVDPQVAPTEPAPDPTPPAPDPAPPTGDVEEPSSSTGPWFECSAADSNGEQRLTPTAPFDAAADAATWHAVAVDQPLAPRSTSEFATYVTGTLAEVPDEDLTETEARAAAFVAGLAPDWGCTVWSPVTDVVDPSRPGPIVDGNNVVTNRLGGMCFVPNASADPESAWGVEPSLAAALDGVVGLTEWRVILADGGGNGQGPDRLWLEYTFEADPSAEDPTAVARVEADVTTAVAAAGTAAGVATECTSH